MSTSAVNYRISPQVSGAMRYERVAQLEAVLALRARNRRVKIVRGVIAGLAGLTAALVLLAWS